MAEVFLIGRFLDVVIGVYALGNAENILHTYDKPIIPVSDEEEKGEVRTPSPILGVYLK